MGLVIPRVLERSAVDGWRHSWLILGAAVLLLGVVALVFLRDRPEDIGLRPVAATSDAIQSAEAGQASAQTGWAPIYRNGLMWHLAFVYVAFGFSYVIYSTFFARYLIAEGGYTRQAAGNLWAIIGWISIVSGIVWGSASDRIGRKYGLALVYLIQALSFGAFALWRTQAGHIASVIAFGMTGWSIPGIIAAACSDYAGARLAPAAFGFTTLFFGIGQAVGPTVAGSVADAAGTFAPAFLLASTVALLGAVGSLALRPPQIPLSSQ
jgi:sugar phosphate permease